MSDALRLLIAHTSPEKQSFPPLGRQSLLCFTIPLVFNQHWPVETTPPSSAMSVLLAKVNTLHAVWLQPVVVGGVTSQSERKVHLQPNARTHRELWHGIAACCLYSGGRRTTPSLYSLVQTTRTTVHKQPQDTTLAKAERNDKCVHMAWQASGPPSTGRTIG